jgi:hypothetical protein
VSEYIIKINLEWADVEQVAREYPVDLPVTHALMEALVEQIEASIENNLFSEIKEAITAVLEGV